MMKHVKYCLLVLLSTVVLCTLNAQQYKTGVSFTYTDTDGVERTYKVVGENLITNPSFDEGTTDWIGGAGGILSNTEVNISGGVDGGAYIRPTSSAGKGSNSSIGTTWEVEKGKTYVFSCFMRNSSKLEAENPAGDGFIRISISDVPYDERCVLLPYPHVDADLSWTQNTWIVNAEYSFLSFSARWLGGAKCFDSFILAEVEELPNPYALEKLLAECNDCLLVYENPVGKYEFQTHIAAASKMLASFGSYSINDVNKMINKLKDAQLGFRIKNADAEHAVDITERYLKNTKFESKLQDWTIVNPAIYGGLNSRPFAYFDGVMSFVCEIEGKPSVESSISQMVGGLPNGHYRFSVQCVMEHDIDVDNSNLKSGAIIFCNGVELDMLPKQSAESGANYKESHPETFSIETYISSSDSVALGFKALPDANFTYVAIDNVKLECLGVDLQTIIPKYGTDVTDYLLNPDFERRIYGWNFIGGYLIAETAADWGYNGTKFVESWVGAPATLTDREWWQSIKVPNGVYSIKSMAHAVQQSDTTIVPSGVYIYANNEQMPVTTTYTNSPAEYDLVTVVTDSILKIGYRVVNCNVNWVAWDNIRMTRYNAETTNEALVMYAKDEMNALKVVAEELMRNKFQMSLRNDMNQSISSIEDVFLWTEAKSLWETQKEQIEAAKLSIAAYRELQTKIAYAQSWQSKEFDKGRVEFNQTIADAVNVYDSALLGVEEVKVAGKILDDAVLTFFVQNADGKEAMDVTDRYITNSALRKSGEGWDGTWPSYLGYEVLEFYNCDFDMYQKLTGLPNGLYVVSVQGFYSVSHGGGDDAYNEGKEKITAELYANNVSSPLVSVYKYKVSEMGIDDNDGVLDDYVNRLVAVEKAFDTTNPVTGIPYYAENSVEVFVQDGNLTIGLHNKGHMVNSWCAFRDFKLEYYGDFPYVMLGRWADKAQEWLDEHAETLPKPTYDELADEIEASRECINSNIYKYDEVIARIRECENLFIKVKNVPDLVEQLRGILLQIEELLLLKYPGTDVLLVEHKKAIPLVKAAADFELNEGQTSETYYQEVIANLKESINAYHESQSATLTQPADYTHRIVMPNFTSERSYDIPVPWVVDNVLNENTGDVWVGPCRPQKPDGENTSGLNSWSYDFTSMNVYQDLVGIPNGIYSVSAQAITQGLGGQHVYARSANDMAVSPEMSIVGWDTYEWETLMTEQIIVTDGKLRIGFASTCAGGVNGWFQVTNFKLYYYGKPAGMDQYKVSYVVDGEVVHTDLVDSGCEILRPQAPEKEGYTFVGWEGPEIMPAEDVVMIGKYTVNSYNIEYIVDGVVLHTSTVAYGSTITVPTSIPKKEGYTFIGWSNLPSTMPASDVVTSAIFKINKYCITYVVDDTVVTTDSITFGSYISPIDAPVKEGYTFIEWDGMPIIMPACEVTVRAIFIVNKYLVTFKIDGQVIMSESLEYGAWITAPNVPEREGYTFSGWIDVAETVPAHDVVYEANYSVNFYQLIYMVDGEIAHTDSVAYGTVIELIAEPVKEGHTFSGWSDVPETMPAGDVTINGTFAVNKYVVTFTIDGVTISSNSLAYGSVISVPSMPEREGYTFSGWSGVDATMPARDVTYDASYIANVYKVYYFVGATLVHTEDVAYGEAIPEYIYGPTVEGDEFLGWIGEAYVTMPAHDVTYTANIVNGVNQFAIDNSQLTIYDLSGRKILVDSLRELEKGIYIIDGRKAVVGD